MTATTEVKRSVKVRPSQLRANPWNRKRFDEDALQELADSFQTVGQLQPIVVRPFEPELIGDRYEIVAGERRWRAAQLLDGFEIDAIVRELTDVEVVECLTVENAQREDVHELDEAVQYRFLIDNGYDVDLVATKVGKSRSYVYQRLKLAELSDRARELFLDDRITAGHAILLARLPQATQDELLDERMFFEMEQNFGDPYLAPVRPDNVRAEALSVRQLDNLIQTEVLLNLDRTAFDPDDAELVPEAGSCTACIKRTGSQPDLFPSDVSGNHCTDQSCFERKIDRFLEVKHAEVVASGEPFELVSEHGTNPKLQFKHALASWGWQECKKTAHGAVRGLIVTGPRRGLVLWVYVTAKYKVKPESTAADDKWARERRAEAKNRKREELITRTVQGRLWDRVVLSRADGARVAGTLDLEDMRRLAVRLWCEMWHEHRKTFYRIKGWEKPEGRDKFSQAYDEDGIRRFNEMDQSGLCAILVELSFITTLSENNYRGSKREGLHDVAKRDRVDVKAIRKEVIAELKAKDEKKGKKQKKPAKQEQPAAAIDEPELLSPTEDLAKITGDMLITADSAIAAVMKFARRNKLISRGKVKTVLVSAVLDEITDEKIGTRITIEELEEHVKRNLWQVDPTEASE